MSDQKVNEGRLSRWSKRKMAVAREEELEDREPVAGKADPAEPDAKQAELEAQHEANRLAAEAVDLTTLTEESDFSVFMKDGVPQMLKKQAMASLWRTSPIFANVDGLVDYDDDFGSPDLVMKTFKSAYQAGRGYLDLFKEDDAPEQGEGVESEIAEGDQTERAINVEDEPAEATVVEDAEMEEFREPDDEAEFIEEEPAPKISLRRRLELDAAG